MSVIDCLAKVVASGQITQKTADQARDMYERMNQEFSRTIGPASADAEAALAAARALRVRSADKVREIASQVATFREGEQRLAEHPAGMMAAIAGMLTRDLWRDIKAFLNLPDTSPVKRGMNVDYLKRSTERVLFQKFETGMQAYKPGLAGATKAQLNGVANMVREIFGVDTGDAVAKQAAKGWTDAAQHAVDLAKAAGKVFPINGDWRVPQFWKGARVASIGPKVFHDDMIAAADKGALTIWNHDTNKPVSLKDRDFVINRAYMDITNAGGASAPFSKEMRTFQFAPGAAGARAWLELQGKYGPGTNIMQMLTGHLSRMASDIALAHVFGPHPEANFRALYKIAKSNPGIPAAAVGKANPARLIARFTEGKGTVEGMFKVATGEVHPTHDDFTSGLLGAMRSMNVASSLRQAVFTVVPSDSITQLLAANHMGMSGLSHTASIFTGGVSKADAAHLNIQAHNMMDYISGIRDYDDHISALQATGKLASSVVKLTGLDWWAQAGKRTWAGDVLNKFAQEMPNKLADVDPKFKGFLQAYGVTENDWGKIQSAGTIDLSGAKYLDPKALQAAEPALYHRVMGAIEEQGAFAMHQPDLRLRSMETGAALGMGPGKGMELFKSLMQFKTFALSRMTTQMMRILTDGPIENRVMRGLAFATLGLGAGAVSRQALQIVNGKDLLDMTKPSFWAEAAVKGIGGYYFDVLEAAMRGDRGAGDVMSALGGPAANAFADALRIATSPIKEKVQEEEGLRKERQSTFGRSIVSFLSRNTPSTWYTRMAVDRLWWDKLQTLVDPDYRKSWERQERFMQKDTGAGFYWPRGESLPTRPPDLSTALGRQ